MSPGDLLVPLIATEGFVLALLLAVLAFRVLRRRRRDPRAERELESIRRALTRAIVAHRADPTLLPGDRTARRNREEAVLALAAQVSGRSTALLREAARELGTLDSARRLCDSRWWWRRLRGVQLLDLLEVEGSLRLRMWDDPDPLVRARVAEWLGQGQARTREVDLLLELLTDLHPYVRFSAAAALLRVGWSAVEPVVTWLEDTARPVGEHLLEVVAGLASPDFAAPLLARLPSFSGRERALVARYLGRIGGAAGLRTLGRLLADAHPEVRAEAVRSLGLLGAWRRAPEVGRRLGDDHWEVRRESALALSAFGAPGRLVLRRAARGADAYARDMALQVLETPSAALRSA